MEVRTHPLPPPGLACVMQDLKLLSFNVQWFRDLGASFSSFGCFVFESWVLCFRVVCFVEFWVLRFRDLGASCFGFVFECFVFEATMHAPRAQVKIISICLDFIAIALFSLIVFQFLRDFKLNKGLYRSIDAWSFRMEHKTFLRCCVVNLR